MAATTNPKLRNVVELFNALPVRQPSDISIVGSSGTDVITVHVQGVARLGAGYVMTHSNVDGSDGVLLIDDGSRKAKAFPLAEGSIDGNRLSHPGGCQLIGDYLVTGFEPIPANHNVSRIRFFDLSNPAHPVAMTEPAPIERHDQKAGAVGVANLTQDTPNGPAEFWFVGIYDNGRVDIHRSDGRPFPGTGFSLLFSATIPDGYEGLCLVAEETNQLFAVAFRQDSRLRDKAELYAVLLDTQKLELLESREFRANLIENTHFRWGTGVDIRSRDEFAILVSGRNFLPACHINTFSAKAG